MKKTKSGWQFTYNQRRVLLDLHKYGPKDASCTNPTLTALEKHKLVTSVSLPERWGVWRWSISGEGLKALGVGG